MLEGIKGDRKFISRAGRGEWIPANSLTSGLALGNTQQIEVPKNLATDYRMRGWNAAVPAMGIRIRGTRTPDVGVARLQASKLQLLSHYEILLVNDYKNPMMQSRENLAAIAFIGMLVNPEAEWLDQYFVDDDTRPVQGIVPQSFVSPDLGIVGNTAKAFLTQNPSNYPYLNPKDSFWRQLEGLFDIAVPVPAAGTFDVFQCFPLCAGTGSLVRDSIPLDTLCDLAKPWKLQITIARDPAASFCKVAGTFVTTRIDLYLYAIPQRDTDPRQHGLPYIIRHSNRAQSPLQYQPGEVVLFSGTLPVTGNQTFTDTVNGNAYNPCIVYGDFKGDLTTGNVLEWATTGQIARFPYWFQNRNPRHVYDSIANARPRHHLTRYGSPTDVVVRGGRNLVASTGVANTVDAANLSTLLGVISPWPARIFACTALELEGFPGFGALDRECGVPYVTITGTYDFSGSSSISAINGMGGMVDVILNNSAEDKVYIEDLGRGCCRDGTVVFAPTASNPDSPTAAIIAGKVTTMEEVKPSDPSDMAKVSATVGGAPTNMNAAVAAAAASPAMVKGT